jgi:polyhydroxyalkanoate synthesis regulator phasin
MKLLLDVKDDKAEAFMDMLQALPYVKVKPLEAIHFNILDDAIQIVDDVHLIEQGKLETRDAKEFLNELLCQNDAKV